MAELARRHQEPGEHVNSYRWTRPASEGGVSDEDLWEMRRQLRQQLVTEARRRVRESWLERGASPAELSWTENILDPDVLTIGFARRVPTYKRLTLMINNPDRLAKILTDPERPVQILVAGKSHPDDEPGVSLIQRLVSFADGLGVRDRIAFLPNYDMDMAQVLMPGVDVWLNNPLRPLEASGTFDGNNGWAIPTADGVDDPARRDQIEGEGLYDLIEKVVAPRFYERDERGIPRRWMEMMRHTLATLGPAVQAQRMVADYVEQLYTPIASSSRVLNAPGHEAARELSDYKARVRAGWDGVAVKHVESHIGDIAVVGDTATIKADVQLGNLRPEDVEVQVVIGRVGNDDNLTNFSVLPMELRGETGGLYSYGLDAKLRNSGPFGYSIRVVPTHRLMAGYTELGLVCNAERAANNPTTHFYFGS